MDALEKILSTVIVHNLVRMVLPTETAKTEMLMLSRMMDKLEKLEKIAQRAEGEDPDEDEDLMATVTKTDRNTGKEFRGSLMLVPKKFAAPEQRCSLFIFHR